MFNDGRDYSYSYTIVPYLTEETKDNADLVAISKQWRDAESFDEDTFNKESAAVDEKIKKVEMLMSYSQKADIEAARAAYEHLTEVQKTMVNNLDILEKAEAEIENLKDSKAYIKDRSGKNHNAEITDSALIYKDATSPLGYSFEGGFPVPDEDGSVNAALSGSSRFTMEIWVNPANLNADNGFIMKGDQQVSIKLTNGGLEYYIHNGGWQVVEVPCAQAGFKANAWNHVAATYDGSTMRLYVNGEEVGNKSISTTINSVTYPLGIGQNYDPNHAGKRLNGKMAAAHVYSTALTADQIKARYDADLGNGTSEIGPDSANVVVWYDANDYTVEKAETPDKPSEDIEEIKKQLEEAKQKQSEAEQAKAEAEEKLAAAEAKQAAAEKALEEANKQLENEKFSASKVKIKSVKAAKKRAKVTWNKVTNADGYVIQYASNVKFKNKKSVTVKDGQKVSRTLKRLKSKKNTYIRIRAYRNVDGKKIYTKFSAAKKVRAK